MIWYFATSIVHPDFWNMKALRIAFPDESELRMKETMSENVQSTHQLSARSSNHRVNNLQKKDYIKINYKPCGGLP